MSNLAQCIKNHFTESIQTKIDTADSLVSAIEQAARGLGACLLDGHKILCCGNGGSASDALHFSGELLNRLERERPSLPAIALNADIATMTAIGNDYSFNEIYSKQLCALGQPGDLLLVLTTSGNSQNILEAVKTAHKRQINVVALTGKDGGKLKSILEPPDIEIRVPSSRTMRIQETHELIIHCLCDLVDQLIFGEINS